MQGAERDIQCTEKIKYHRNTNPSLIHCESAVHCRIYTAKQKYIVVMATCNAAYFCALLLL